MFNFTDSPVEKTLPLRRIGLSEARDFKATELWSHDNADMRGSIVTSLSPRDVKVFRIEK